MRIKLVVQDGGIDSIEIKLAFILLILLDDLFLPIDSIFKDA